MRYHFSYRIPQALGRCIVEGQNIRVDEILYSGRLGAIQCREHIFIPQTCLRVSHHEIETDVFDFAIALLRYIGFIVPVIVFRMSRDKSADPNVFCTVSEFGKRRLFISAGNCYEAHKKKIMAFFIFSYFIPEPESQKHLLPQPESNQTFLPASGRCVSFRHDNK